MHAPICLEARDVPLAVNGKSPFFSQIGSVFCFRMMRCQEYWKETAMNKTMKFGLLAGACTVVSVATVAQGCTVPPPTPPPTAWVQHHGFNTTKTAWEIWVGQEISLENPPTALVCACGLRLAGGIPTPPGTIEIKEAHVFIVNRATHEMQPTPFFNFQNNDQTTAGLMAAQPGGQWFGFSSPAGPFTAPQLPPGFVYKLLFLVNVHPFDGQPLFPVHILVGGGVTGPDGVPGPDFHYFSPVDDTAFIPSTGTAALLGLGALAGARRRRR